MHVAFPLAAAHDHQLVAQQMRQLHEHAAHGRQICTRATPQRKRKERKEKRKENERKEKKRKKERKEEKKTAQRHESDATDLDPRRPSTSSFSPPSLLPTIHSSFSPSLLPTVPFFLPPFFPTIHPSLLSHPPSHHFFPSSFQPSFLSPFHHSLLPTHHSSLPPFLPPSFSLQYLSHSPSPKPTSFSPLQKSHRLHIWPCFGELCVKHASWPSPMDADVSQVNAWIKKDTSSFFLMKKGSHKASHMKKGLRQTSQCNIAHQTMASAFQQRQRASPSLPVQRLTRSQSRSPRSPQSSLGDGTGPGVSAIPRVPG